MEKKLCYKV